jgi:hypothetical protein
MNKARTLIFERDAGRQKELQANLIASGHDVLGSAADFGCAWTLVNYMVLKATKVDVVVVGNRLNDDTLPGLDAAIIAAHVRTAMPGITIIGSSQNELLTGTGCYQVEDMGSIPDVISNL